MSQHICFYLTVKLDIYLQDLWKVTLAYHLGVKMFS